MTKKPKNRLADFAAIQKVEVKSRAELRQWLKKHHGQLQSVWLVTYKKSEPQFYIGYDAIVEEALCFGWIDSLPRALDKRRTMLRLSPRTTKSAWSKVNRDRVAKLIKSGLMTEPGLKRIREAKKNGAWDKLKAIDNNKIPTELKNELKRNPRAKEYFDAFPPSSKRAILEWIHTAKTPETKQKRVVETVTLAAKNIRANHYRQPKKSKS